MLPCLLRLPGLLLLLPESLLLLLLQSQRPESLILSPKACGSSHAAC